MVFATNVSRFRGVLLRIVSLTGWLSPCKSLTVYRLQGKSLPCASNGRFVASIATIPRSCIRPLAGWIHDCSGAVLADAMLESAFRDRGRGVRAARGKHWNPSSDRSRTTPRGTCLVPRFLESLKTDSPSPRPRALELFSSFLDTASRSRGRRPTGHLAAPRQNRLEIEL